MAYKSSVFSPSPRRIAWLLALVTLGLYLPVARFGFCVYDDSLYVTENPTVQNGLTWTGLKWAFTTMAAANWHPVTWISHMLDCTLFGLNPAGPHLINALLHAVNAALLFTLLFRLTQKLWPAAFIAALFAWHPMHVESVAWIAERKDVLSTFFALLAFLAYARYAQARRENLPHAWRDYVWCLLAFALALMAKPMLVTFPCVLLLLDFWPLNRWQNKGISIKNLVPFVCEKIPFLLLAAIDGVLTFVAQSRGESVGTIQAYPLGMRVGNAVIAYGRYLEKLVWPSDLIVFYPYPSRLVVWKVGLAAILLAGASVLVFRWHQRRPYLLVGWLWFGVTLLPVIGLVQVGTQAMADRYTYIPSIGVFVMFVWGIGEWSGSWRHRPMILIPGAAVSLLACLALTHRQIGYWRDGETLFRRALTVAGDNYSICYNLAYALEKRGQDAEAISQYQTAIRLCPTYAAHFNLGLLYLKDAQFPQAIPQFQAAAGFKPDDPQARYDLGIAFSKIGQINEAIAAFRDCLHLQPTNAEACYNLGVELSQAGQPDAALQQYQETVRLNPDHAGAHYNLGNALFKLGRLQAAACQYQETLRLEPNNAEAHNNLGIILFQYKQLDAAIFEFQKAAQLKPDFEQAQKNLAQALTQKHVSHGE